MQRNAELLATVQQVRRKLSSPGALATEIVAELEAALAQFSQMVASLPVDRSDGHDGALS